MKKFILCILASFALTMPSFASDSNLFDKLLPAAGEIAESRNLNGFQRIENQGSTDVYYIQSNRYIVEVVGRVDEIKRVETSVSDGILKIRLKKGSNFFNSKLRIRVSCPVLTQVTNRGSGNFYAKKSISVSKPLQLETIGSGDMFVNAINSNGLIVKSRGSGDIKIEQAKSSGNVEIETVGSGDISCSANGTNVSIESRGSGDVRYSGSSRSIKMSTRGSGDITAKVNTQSVEAHTFGSGDITLSGSTRNLNSSHRGSGDIYSSGLRR